MRFFPILLPPFALAAGVLLSPMPACAQQASPPGDLPPAPVTAPHTPGVLPSFVPDSVPEIPLVIPSPPGAKLRVEMDARSEDILGMMKSFLKGIGETGPASAKTPGQPPASPNPLAEALEAGNLADILKDVNHVHFVVWELPGPPTPLPSLLPAKPLVKGVKPAAVLPRPPASPLVPSFDSNAFYESAFGSEGARRVLFTDADVYKLVMVGFPERHGFAFAVSGAGYVAVSRSDGYPNMEVLSAFISHVTSSVMKSKAAQKILDSTMNSGDTPSKPAPSPDKSSGE